MQSAVIPIVFALDSDPVASGLVARLAQPGGNVTGLSLQIPEVTSKRLELLREIVPSLRQLAIMTNLGHPAAVLERGEAQAAVRRLGFEFVTLDVRRADDIAPGLEALKGRADALYVCTDPLVTAIGFASTPWHWLRDYRRCSVCGS